MKLLAQQDRNLLLWGSLLAAVLAQHALTPHPEIATVALLVLGTLLVYGLLPSSQIRKEALFAIMLVVALILLSQIPIFILAPALFTLSALLFLSAIPKEEMPTEEPFTRQEILFLTFILLVGFGLLDYDLENIPPGLHGDEAEVGMQALQILTGKVRNIIGVGWYDQPLVGFMWPAVTMGLLGDTVFGLRLSSALMGIGSLVFTYLLARLLFGRGVALLATFLMAVGHWFIGLNRIGVNYTQSTFLEVATFYFLFRAMRNGQLLDWILSGLGVGAGLYLYYASRIVPALIAVFLLVVSLREEGFWQKRRRGIFVLFLAATLMFLPQGVYFLEHPAGFLSRTQSVFLFSSPENMQHFTGTAAPIDAFLIQTQRLLSLFNYGVDHSGQYGYKGPMLDFVSAVFLVLGAAYSLFRIRDRRYLFLSLWFWMTLLLGGVLTLPAPFTPRLVGMMPAVYILAGIALNTTLSRIADFVPQPRRLLATPVLLGGILISTAFLNYQMYFQDYTYSLDGWAQQEPATVVAKYIRDRSDTYEFYLLGAPRLYLRHGTIRFLARNFEGADVQNPEALIPLPQPPSKDVAYILLPEYLNALPLLKTTYPQGQEEVYLRSDGRIWFVAYEVSREEVIEALVESD